MPRCGIRTRKQSPAGVTLLLGKNWITIMIAKKAKGAPPEFLATIGKTSDSCIFGAILAATPALIS